MRLLKGALASVALLVGTSGEAPSHWHQFVRVWYRND